MQGSPRIEECKNFNAGRRAQNQQLPKSKRKGGKVNKLISSRKEALKFTFAVLVANATCIPALLYIVYTFHPSDTVSTIIAGWLGISIAAVLKQWFPQQDGMLSKLIELVVTRFSK